MKAWGAAGGGGGGGGGGCRGGGGGGGLAANLANASRTEGNSLTCCGRAAFAPLGAGPWGLLLVSSAFRSSQPMALMVGSPPWAMCASRADALVMACATFISLFSLSLLLRSVSSSFAFFSSYLRREIASASSPVALPVRPKKSLAVTRPARLLSFSSSSTVSSPMPACRVSLAARPDTNWATTVDNCVTNMLCCTAAKRL